ncbi:MAG: hypothetical protein HRT99_03455 [Mycoplasmatales bacterium]|nr:hypothetical protein [Mycoplasmatales bacterium]
MNKISWEIKFNEKKAREIADKNFSKLKYKEPNNSEKFWLSGWATFLFWLFVTLSLFIFVFLFSSFNKKRRNIVQNLIPNKNKIWLESYAEYIKSYDDVIKLENSKIALKEIANKNRGLGVPRDAKIIEWGKGNQVFLEEEKSLVSFVANWMWTRSNGKSTQTYYKRILYTIVDGADKKFTSKKLSLKDNTVFRGTGDLLESKKFNKEFSPSFEDKIALRMMLTPYAQENLLKLKEQKKLKSFELRSLIDKKLLLLSINISQNRRPFTANLVKISDLKTRDKALASIKKDFLLDLKAVLNPLEALSTLNIFT